MLTDALSRKKTATSEPNRSDSEVAMTANIAENVVSLEAFQSRKSTVPKMSPLCRKMIFIRAFSVLEA